MVLKKAGNFVKLFFSKKLRKSANKGSTEKRVQIFQKGKIVKGTINCFELFSHVVRKNSFIEYFIVL